MSSRKKLQPIVVSPQNTELKSVMRNSKLIICSVYGKATLKHKAHKHLAGGYTEWNSGMPILLNFQEVNNKRIGKEPARIRVVVTDLLAHDFTVLMDEMKYFFCR